MIQIYNNSIEADINSISNKLTLISHKIDNYIIKQLSKFNKTNIKITYDTFYKNTFKLYELDQNKVKDIYLKHSKIITDELKQKYEDQKIDRIRDPIKVNYDEFKKSNDELNLKINEAIKSKYQIYLNACDLIFRTKNEQ